MNWSEWILANELNIRLSFFFGIFFIMAFWESLKPRRTLLISRSNRWLSNLGIVFLNSLTLRLLFPTAAVGIALFAQKEGWGLLNHLDLSYTLEVIIAIVALDLAIYLQHVLFHLVPVLWRLHQVHHADLDYDVTTGARFHTIEIILSMLIKFLVILILGPPIVAVVIFEVLLNANAMFNHSNISLPRSLDRVVRWFIVTPDMHRVHHSSIPTETNSNYGFNLTIWDRLFKTYQAQPSQGHTDMQIGLSYLRDPKQTNRLTGMLLIPFKRR